VFKFDAAPAQGKRFVTALAPIYKSIVTALAPIYKSIVTALAPTVYTYKSIGTALAPTVYCIRIKVLLGSGSYILYRKASTFF
jgi:hypothetical protein